MRLLWIGTKPPWPPIDGGRLVAWTTLEALAGQGVEIDVVAPETGPVEPAEPPRATAGTTPGSHAPYTEHLVAVHFASPARSLLRAQLDGLPLSIVRHRLAVVRRQVAALVDARTYDAVHVEQVQALAQAGPAVERRLPLVLRTHNVESDLWRGMARLHPFARQWLAVEARRMARYESRALRRASLTVALTGDDAERLRELAPPEIEVRTVPPPFPAQLPTAAAPLDGEPALVMIGSRRWPPNRDAHEWFLRRVWPTILLRLPAARLHLFLGTGERHTAPAGVVVHTLGEDSQAAFAPGAILLVPLRVGSGIRMKILEAWARGVCVVATPTAVAGLDARDGDELLVASDREQFSAAVERLTRDEALCERLLAGGRRALRERHDPAETALRLVRAYRNARASAPLP